MDMGSQRNHLDWGSIFSAVQSILVFGSSKVFS